MKKILIFAGAVAVLFSSCTKNIEPAAGLTSSDQLITFEAPVVAPSTKAGNVVYDATYPTNWSFNVASVWYADTYNWATATSFITLQEASYSTEIATNGAWITNNQYFWPKNGKLAFQAFSPSTEYSNGEVGAGGVSFPEYSVATDGSQVDLMYADLVKDATKLMHPVSSSYSPDGVQLKFNHALSSVVFTARTAETYSDVVIKLKEILLEDVYVDGDFTQGLAADGETAAPAWTKADDAVLTDYDNIIPEITVTDTEKALIDVANVNDMLVMPQKFAATTKVRIKYSINQNSEGAIDQEYSVCLNDLLYTGLDDNVNKGFEIGKKYIFNIIIGLDRIFFSPEIVEWKSVTTAAENAFLNK